MSEFDDRDLSRRLRAAAGSDPDFAAARQAVQRRVVRARRRRTAVLSTTAAVLLLSFGVVAAVNRQRGTDQLRTADTGVVTGTVDTGAVTSTAAEPSPSTTDSPGTTLVGGGVDDRVTTTVADPGQTVVATEVTTTVPDLTAQPVVPPPPTSATTAPPDAPPPTTTAPPPTTTAAPAGAQVQTFSRQGNSITVQLLDGRMELLGTTPAAGWSVHEQHATWDEIEVQFSSGSADATIHIHLVDGQMQQEDEHDEASTSHDD